MQNIIIRERKSCQLLTEQAKCLHVLQTKLDDKTSQLKSVTSENEGLRDTNSKLQKDKNRLEQEVLLVELVLLCYFFTKLPRLLVIIADQFPSQDGDMPPREALFSPKADNGLGKVPPDAGYDTQHQCKQHIVMYQWCSSNIYQPCICT